MSNPQPRAPMTHDLKCWPDPFQAVYDGLKTFEWRKADRDYQEGDSLHLQEWEPYHFTNGEGATLLGSFTGREITVTVTYILSGPDFGIPEGYCIMGIKRRKPEDLAPKESDVLLAMAKGTIPVTEQAIIELLGTMAINRWLKAGLVEWHEPNPHAPAGAYALTDKGRLAAVGATPDPQEGGKPDA